MTFRNTSILALLALVALTQAGCDSSEAKPDCSGADCGVSPEGKLPPIDPAARSCEFLLQDEGARVDTVHFDDSVRGTHLRQEPLTAVTFFAAADAAIARDAIQIDLKGEGDVRIARTRCYGRDGVLLD